MYSGDGVVTVSNLTAVVEKKAAISIGNCAGNGVLGKFNKVYLIQLSRWRGREAHMSNALDQIPVDKTWSPTESSRKIKPEVQ